MVIHLTVRKHILKIRLLVNMNHKPGGFSRRIEKIVVEQYGNKGVKIKSG